MGPKSRVNHYNQSTNTPQSVSTYGTNAYKEQFLLFIHPINTTLSPKNDWNNTHPPQGVLCIIEVLQKSWDFSWQNFSTHIDSTASKGQYGREQIPSTPGSFDSLKMPTGICLFAAVVGFLDPQSGGYIGNTRVYIHIYIGKQYMTKAYTLISFHYNHVNSLLGLFLFARYSLWRNT